MSAHNPPSPTFIDTNIWLYAFNDSQDAQKTRLAKRVIRQTPHLSISTQVVNEVCYTMLRKFGAEETGLQKLIRSFYRKYIVIAVDRAIMVQASHLRLQYHFSYWDGVIVSSALYAGATRLYSEDMHDGLVVNGQLTILNPFKANTLP